MTLPASFPLSVSQINVELGRSAGAPFDIQGTAERGLAEVPSGAISMSDFLGKSNQGFAYIGSTNLGNGSSSYSQSISIGTASLQRRVVCIINWENGGQDTVLTSASIGGVGATIHQQAHQFGGTTGLGVAIISAIVTTGTTGTLALTFPRNTTATYAGTWALKNYNTIVDSNVDGSGTTTRALSISLATSPGGIIIAGYTGATNTQSTAVTWSNITSVYDFADAGRESAAWVSGLGSGSRTIGASQGVISNAGNDMVAVSWSI